MKKPKLTLLIPLTLLFILLTSSSFAFIGTNSQQNVALPTAGYHPETNSIVTATPSMGLKQINEGPWIFSAVSGMEPVDLLAFAMDEDVEDADIDPAILDGVKSDHGLWKCEWYVEGHTTPIEVDDTPTDLGSLGGDEEHGSARKFEGTWIHTTATTGPNAWITEAGDYDIYAVIYDLAGNTVTTDSVKIWIDPTPAADFTVDLDEMAYMSGDLMRFTASVSDISHIHLVEIEGPDGTGGTNTYTVSEIFNYNDRHTTNNVFRYGWDGTDFNTLIYEMPTWLIGLDGLYNFTFEYEQPTGRTSQYTLNFIELDNAARPIALTSIRGLREIGGVWTQLPTMYLQDGDMVEVTVSYTDTYYPLQNQNGTLWVDYSAIDADGEMFLLNKEFVPGETADPAIVYDGGTDTFAYNYTIQNAVDDGDYYLPIYSKSVLGHYEYEDQANARVDIDNDAIGFDWTINSPTGIYSNGDTIYIQIAMDNADPSTWIETLGPYAYDAAGDYPMDNAYPGTAVTYLTTGFTTEWDNDDEADIAKLNDDTFHIQFTFDTTTDPNRDGFWYINVTAGDGNPNTATVTKTIPIFYDYELGDLEFWNVRYPDEHPNSATSLTLNLDLDGDGTPTANELLNSKVEVVVTGRVPGRTDIVQSVECNEQAYVIGYNTTTGWTSPVTKTTAYGQNWVTFENIPDHPNRNLSVQAEYSTGVDTYVHYLNATTPDEAYTNWPTHLPGNLLVTDTPPVITTSYATSVKWQVSTLQYTAKPDLYKINWAATGNDDTPAGSKIFNSTLSDPGDHIITGYSTNSFITQSGTSGSASQVEFGTLNDVATNGLEDVTWYFFVNATDGSFVSYEKWVFTTDNSFGGAGGSYSWTNIAGTEHDEDVTVTLDADDGQSDIDRVEIYYTRNVLSHVNPVDSLPDDIPENNAELDAITTSDTWEDLPNGDYNFYVVPYDTLGHSPIANNDVNETWYIEKPAWVNITSPLDIMDADGFDNTAFSIDAIREHFGPGDGTTFMGSLRNGEQITWEGHANAPGTLEYLVLNDTDTSAAVGQWGPEMTNPDAEILRGWSSTPSYTIGATAVTEFHEGGLGLLQPFRIFILVRDSKNGTASAVKTDDNGLFYTVNARNGTHSGTPPHQEDTANLALMTLEFYIDDTKPILDEKTLAGGSSDDKMNLVLTSAHKGGNVADDATLTDGDTITAQIRLNSSNSASPTPDATADDYDASGDLYVYWELEWQNGTAIDEYDYSDGYYTTLIPVGGITDNIDVGYGAEENAYQFVYVLSEATPGWEDLQGDLTINVYVMDYAMLMGGDTLSSAPGASVTISIDMTDPDITVDYVDANQQDMYADGDSIALKVTTEENNWTVDADFSALESTTWVGDRENHVYVEDTCANGEYIVTYTIDSTAGLTSGWKQIVVTVADDIGRSGTATFWTGLDAGALSLVETDRFGAKFTPNYLWMHQGQDDLVLNVTALVTTKDHFMLNDDSIELTDGYTNLPVTIDYDNVTGGMADYPTKPWKWYHWLIPINVPADLAASVNWSRVTLIAYGSPTQVDPTVDPDMWLGTVENIVYNAWVDNEDPELYVGKDSAMSVSFKVQPAYDYTGGSTTVFRDLETPTAIGAGFLAWQTGSVNFAGGAGYVDGVPEGGSIGPLPDGQYYICGTLGGGELVYPSLIGWDNTAPAFSSGSFSPSASKPTQMVDVSLTVVDAGRGTASVRIYIPTINQWYDLTNTGGNTWEGQVNAPMFEGTYYTQVEMSDGPNTDTEDGPLITVDAEAPGINAFVASDTTPVVGDTVDLTLALDDEYTVQMFADGTPLTVTQDPDNPTVYTATYTGNAPGPVGILASVADEVWTTSSYLVLEFVEEVDTVAPVITSLTKSEGYTGDEISFAVSAYDNVGVSSVEIAVDGSALTTETTGDTTTATWEATKGSHTVTATVSDAAGNTVEESITFEIEDAPKEPIDPVYWMGGAIILIMLVGLGLTFLRKGGAA